ncbi:hypothetical protein [Streptomyces sp. SPB4]|uniref:hypothetical protein n=1 Tax=Streptomyces sp. SPB4 TaxID=2940553 RepID=UPI0024744FC4|nr:hypothetical protein [Streptomyces sp. SPB4]MDH6545547.1 type IV secretion system protein TrbL [Streptomyces sp. SPB4]
MDGDPGGIVMRRFAALLLALSALLGVSVSAPQPAAAADGGLISSGVRLYCEMGRKISWGLIPDGKNGNPKAAGTCRTLGDIVEASVKKEWAAVWNSVLGDVIKSGVDATKWLIKTVLTTALVGPSLDLEATGLWGDNKGKPTLAGMLMWLGLLIAAAGVIWQAIKMALTGQSRHLGRSMLGWVENLVLCTVGVGLFVQLLLIGDAISTGLIDVVFTDNDAYGRIIAVMIPVGVANPVLVSGMVGVLLLVGFSQLVTSFLRLSAIPIICLLLPVAGAGRTGGDTTRKWAPNLITAGLVIVAYKPMVTIIICTGFSEFGKSQTLAEWLRGFATLLLAVLAPVPLMKVFAPFGATAGGGLASGGVGAALGAAASYFGSKKGSGGEGVAPATPMAHARLVEQTMGDGGDPPPPPPPGGGGIPMLPAPSGPDTGSPREGTDGPGREGPGRQAAPPGVPSIPAQSGSTPSAVPATSSTGAAMPGPAAAIGIGIQVMDGVNDVVQKASGEVGGGSGQ